jgi:glycosyltransferase involved in cell wall biosynthesis
MVLIEAMVCGVPCVSYDCPCGPSDIIKNNEDGFLVKNGDYNEFASKINRLIEDNTLRKEMGKKAKQNVLRYLPETIVKQWDNLFNDLLK